MQKNKVKKCEDKNGLYYDKGEYIMFSKKRRLSLISILLIVLIFSFSFIFVSCSGDENTSMPDTTVNENVGNVADENVQTTEGVNETKVTNSPSDEKNTVSDYVTKYKKYEIRYGEGDYYIVFLRYREGSNLVAEFTGTFAYPYETENIEELIESDDYIIQQIESLGIEEANVSYARMTNGIEGNFRFVDLDLEGHSATVNLAAQYLSMPMENDFCFNIQNCENALMEFGFELADEN